ncbi:DUF2634 domain-containing protein [Halobacillus trueperi]|uniref:DUF2634 domain-containing protein n=1 Tax=Halobacillus trueperi TaxID=156205 RepID=A0A3D8VM13_9BACI|nr:DUF2634 domain-containing protein [Halobacillus trueperi]RDY70327.1 DUF2634 domain-containing protein [Halobacillus trueperi]
MDNLFPENVPSLDEEQSQSDSVSFGRSWAFDFEKGEFSMDPSGRVKESGPFEAWLEWCRYAVRTKRYAYLAHTDDHGHEFQELISRNLTRGANESEIMRLVKECLLVNPRTSSVDNFSFEWEGARVYFTCTVTNARDESAVIEGGVNLND